MHDLFDNEENVDADNRSESLVNASRVVVVVTVSVVMAAVPVPAVILRERLKSEIMFSFAHSQSLNLRSQRAMLYPNRTVP